MFAEQPIESMATGFLLALARVGGIFSFMPVPGLHSGPELARVFLSLIITIALYPFWPAVPSQQLGSGVFVLWMLAEGALGVAAGLAVAFVCDALVFCMQMAGMQAGFSFASTIDPTTNADSTVLLVTGQLVAGLMFFATGFHRQVIRAVAQSLHDLPQMPPPEAAWPILRLGEGVFTIGLRLAGPTVALLLMLELALAIASRVNAHLQMLSVTFPLKMLAGLIVLALTLPRLPWLFSGQQKVAMVAIEQLLGR